MLIGIDCRKIADFGIGTYIRGLTHALSALPGDERYVLFAPGRHRQLLPAGERFRFVEEDSPKYSYRELPAMRRRIEENGVDVFHSPHYVVPRTSSPMVVTIHDLIHLGLPWTRLLERTYAEWMIGRAVSRSRKILTVSRATASAIALRYPHSSGRIVVAPPGRDAEFSALSTKEDAGIPRRFGVVPGLYFVYAGNDKPHKNLDCLVSAFQKARIASDIRLLLVGSSFPGRASSSVITPGFVSSRELAALYRGAIAVVQPSLEEGFGLPALEAMASATPVLVSRIPALTELTAGAALDFDPRSEEQIAGCLERIVADPALRTRMIEDGLRRARDFEWSRCAEITLRAYRDALGAIAEAR